jgi:hypothetical protein
MRPATLTTVLCLAVVFTVLWSLEVELVFSIPELSPTHEPYPKLWSDLWAVMSPGFR